MTIVGVRFRQAGKVYFFDPGGLAGTALPYGTAVIVETGRGAEYGTVAMERRDVEDSTLVHPVRKVLRLATDHDRYQKTKSPGREAAAKQTAAEIIARHGLRMDLVAAEMNFDSSKVIFYFTAEGRVDFRELVKDLASTLRMRIELRQIGVRDEAKIISGIGSCGRKFCCSSFLEDFSPISIKAAKDQGLSLNPTKISGCCGKLMCCLKYEEETYAYLLKNLPPMGETVETEQGTGEVIGHNILQQSVKVAIRSADASAEKQIKTFPIGEITHKCTSCNGCEQKKPQNEPPQRRGRANKERRNGKS